ncbi:BppU family phage baseplate upper protein [Enterococcus faecium]|nr:BppU family phage baseplate upper protein [Enterococcus faecium]
MVYKMNESIIVIQAEAIKPINTNVVFWSYDRGTAKLRMKLVRKNGIPQSLPEGTTVPIRLIFKSATAEDGYGKHDYLATIEDRVNGIVSIVLEDNILGYVGKVEGSVYIDFPDDRSLDTAGRFTFDIKRSPIDDSTPELEDYYFNGFSQTIDKIEKILADGKQEIEQKIAESETQIEEKLKDTNDKITKANQDVATLNTNIDKANDRIDQTNQQIGDLGKLKKMYSNSIDFGDYDYSGNPNLSAKLNASSFSLGTGATVSDDNDEIVFTLDGKSNLTKYKVGTQVPLIEGKQYTISCEIMLESDFVGDPSGLRLQHAYVDGGVITLATTTVPTLELNTWQKLSGSAIIKYASNTPKQWYTVFRNMISANPTGKVRLRNIKVEEGSKATPYQPNLLDEPYYLSRIELGENLMTGSFPVKNSNYAILGRAIRKPFEVGKTYTFTLKGTKPANQTFRPYNGGTIPFGVMMPVEGQVDVWSCKFTVEKLSATPDQFSLYQFPKETVGDVNIEWLKIEEGDTRTPNISQFKYFGEGLKDSNNPNDYSWDITPEYTEKGLNDSVSLTEPQSVDGTKNFLETPLVNGKNVLVEEKPLPYEAWHSTGTEQTGIPNKARLIIGPVATTIGAKLNRSMKENPLTWNSGNWQATANRDCTLLVEGLVRYQFGGSTAGQYGYITFYKDDAQTSSIGFAGGVGINGTALQWKHGLHFSRIFALKKGEYFNITFETQDGKKLDFSQINTLHIMEIES